MPSICGIDSTVPPCVQAQATSATTLSVRVPIRVFQPLDVLSVQTAHTRPLLKSSRKSPPRVPRLAHHSKSFPAPGDWRTGKVEASHRPKLLAPNHASLLVPGGTQNKEVEPAATGTFPLGLCPPQDCLSVSPLC